MSPEVVADVPLAGMRAVPALAFVPRPHGAPDPVRAAAHLAAELGLDVTVTAEVGEGMLDDGR